MKLGIDLGGTKIAAALVDDDYKIVRKASTPTLHKRHYSEIVKDMAHLALRLIDDSGISIDDVEYVGIGCPGILDRSKGYVLYSNNIRWDHVDLFGEFTKHLDIPLYMDNDANCAALGEFVAGAAKAYTSALTITLGTGVGGGLILDGKIYSGFNAAAGSFGHEVIISGGALCTCGRCGCLEAYASVTALIRMAGEEAKRNPESKLAQLLADGGSFNGKNIFDCAKSGDVSAKELVDQYIFYVGEGITNFVNVLQPDVIVIGGGLSKEGEYLLAPIKKQVAQNVFCKVVRQPEIKIASLGNDAGIIGAAFLKEYQKTLVNV